MFWNTVEDLLAKTLKQLMQAEELKQFRLVGGTALSLHLGHRKSIDIDLFTDAAYGTVDFTAIQTYLLNTFTYVQGDFGGVSTMGKSYLGTGKNNAVKLDIYYSNDPFFQDMIEADGIRIATVEEIIAMKVDVIQRKGRKKDFWDLHELLPAYQISQMITLHRTRFEWTHNTDLIIKRFIEFDEADEDIDPICLRNKEWVFIKEDFEDAVKNLKIQN